MADYKIAIVDDDGMEAQSLADAVTGYFGTVADECHIDVFDGGATFVEKFDAAYDIIFLDVEMSPLDGIATARSVRLRDEHVVIVFVTHFGKYAVAGYSVNAFDYIIKPVVYGELSLKMPRIIREAERKRSRYIFVKTNRDIIKLDVNDILFVEVRNHNIFYNLSSEVYKIKSTLKAVTDELGDGFIQCNSCYLVNMRHIKALIGDSFVVTDDNKLLISRSRKKYCMKAFADYSGGV